MAARQLTGCDMYSASEKRMRIAAKAELMGALDKVVRECGGDIDRADTETGERMKGMGSILRLVLRGNPVAKIRRYLVAKGSAHRAERSMARAA